MGLGHIMIMLGLLYILADALLLFIVPDRGIFVYWTFFFVLAVAIGHIISGAIILRRQRFELHKS